MAVSSSVTGESILNLERSIFLTAYDPSDLPGGSVDPMGFERGYLFLADKILPGLTNAGSRPRYFSVLCAGSHLAQVDAADSPQSQYRKRLDCVLRLERFWALANVLASASDGNDENTLSGLRGVQYARARAELLAEKGQNVTDGDFKMLARQVPYGAIGIYGSVADGMRLLDRKTLILTPDLGERLAEAFIQETTLPKVLPKAVCEDRPVSLTTLTAWGERAHVNRLPNPGSGEASCLRDALHRNSIRSRMAEVLKKHRSEDGEKELNRLRRIARALAGDAQNADFCEAITAILVYEDCYRLTQLGLERLLWLCRVLPAASIIADDLKNDSVMKLISGQLPGAVARFRRALESGKTDNFCRDLCQLDDTRQFLEQGAATADDVWLLAQTIRNRHVDVQHGKFDRGRRKMPWLELSAGRISLTTTRVGGLDFEATRPDRITPHPYRLDSADALIAAAGEL